MERLALVLVAILWGYTIGFLLSVGWDLLHPMCVRHRWPAWYWQWKEARRRREREAWEKSLTPKEQQQMEELGRRLGRAMGYKEGE